jgi:hypothetical protein
MILLESAVVVLMQKRRIIFYPRGGPCTAEAIPQSGDDRECKYEREEAEEGDNKEASERRGETCSSGDGDSGQKRTKVRLCKIRKRNTVIKNKPYAKSRRGIIPGVSLFRTTWKAAWLSRAGLVPG